jgi:hypothetical protein
MLFRNWFALSSNPSGYTREKAVRKLASIRDGRELPYLLARVNDWVSQVREPAREAVLSRITPQYAKHFLQHMELVTRMHRWRRADHSDLVRAIARLLVESAPRAALVAAMNRDLFDILVAADPAIARDALRAKNATVRLRALRMLNEREAYESMLDDPSAPVRAAALLAAGDRERLMAALFDGNANVRDVARFRLRGLDFAALYREALHLPGLAETGSAADAELLLPFLSHASARMRRMAVRAIVKLGGATHVDRVTELLLDPVRSVSTQVRRSLAAHAPIVGADKLWSMFESTTAAHARTNLLLLMRMLPKWDSIALFVRATADRDEAIATTASELASLWNRTFNRDASIPTQRQREALAAALRQSRLDEETADVIRFSLDTVTHAHPASC